MVRIQAECFLYFDQNISFFGNFRSEVLALLFQLKMEECGKGLLDESQKFTKTDSQLAIDHDPGASLTALRL